MATATERAPAQTATTRRAPRKRREPNRVRLFRYGSYLILAVGGTVFIGPWAWMVVASFKPIGEIFSYPPNWWTDNPTIDNYVQFLGGGERVQGGADVARWFFNSAFVAISVTALNLIFCSLAAYCYAKRDFPGRGFLFLLGLGTMAIPYAVFLIPNYLVLKHIPLFGGNDFMGQGGHGWLDSYWGLILPASVSMFNIFLLRQYMRTIPDELIDAARIDGANHWQIWWRIIMPLTRPALAAVGIFTFTSVWDDFLGPLILISSQDLYTVQLGLGLYIIKNRTAWDLVMAGSVLATLPVLLAFIIFQKQFIRGIAITGLK
jgi:multiple sugar transport system permease protein